MTRLSIIIGQELRLARRNIWVLLTTALLALFALALAFLGAGQGARLDAEILSLTAASLATLSVYLIPLIALLTSYDAIAGEIERGTLALTLATPTRRWELFIGKFIAQTTSVGGAILIGLGLAGAAVSAVYGASIDGLLVWLRLMLSTAGLGAVFVALGLMVSAFSTRVATAAALSIGLWLVLVVLYDLALLGGVIAAGDGAFTRVVFPWLVLGNPADAYRIFNLAALDAAPVSGIDGLARTMPFPAQITLVAMAIWAVLPLGLGTLRTKRIVP
ncbi:nitrous oxidase accessory protein (plasmid) [Aestuarium zhoushanense]|nr:nitrous oxidase accessory protein [Aestuarium zhoushanense]